MKKTLSIVLALALALSMFASFAFVLGPSTGVTGATNSALNITKFYTTYDAANLLAGTRLYAPIVDKTDSAFAKNELIQFCVEFEVLNAKTVANGVDPAKASHYSTLVFTSDTVNLSVNQYPGQMALYADAGMDLVNAVKVVNNQQVYKDGTFEGKGGEYNSKKNSLTVKIHFYQNVMPVGFTDDGVQVVAPKDYRDAKATYSLIFSGITKGEITEKGAVQMKTAFDGVAAFVEGKTAIAGGPVASGLDSHIEIERNGRHYKIEKVVGEWDNLLTDATVPSYANLFKGDGKTKGLGYKVTLLKLDPVSKKYVDDKVVAQFDTEVVTYKDIDEDVDGTDIEGIGSSLGLVEHTADGPIKVFKTVLNDGTTVYLRANGEKAFVDAADTGKLARFQTAMDDLGFKTDVGYTYKLTDALFTSAGSFGIVREATYNNGTVVPVEPEADEDPTVDEPTEEEPVEEEPIEEEPVDEEPIDEPIEEPEAPQTGDFAANVAIALTAAAIVAAAALAFVMKKVRD